MSSPAHDHTRPTTKAFEKEIIKLVELKFKSQKSYKGRIHVIRFSTEKENFFHGAAGSANSNLTQGEHG